MVRYSNDCYGLVTHSYRTMEKQVLITVIDEVEAEAERFLQKLKVYREKSAPAGDYQYPSRESGSLKRAALDLKQELTKITQSTSN